MTKVKLKTLKSKVDSIYKKDGILTEKYNKIKSRIMELEITDELSGKKTNQLQIKRLKQQIKTIKKQDRELHKKLKKAVKTYVRALNE